MGLGDTFGKDNQDETLQYDDTAFLYFAVAVLTCIIVKASVVSDEEILIAFDNHYLVAAVVAFVTSLITRNLLLTVILGLLCFAGLKLL